MRILSAMTVVAREHGVQGATVGHVITQAGVSRKTFYEIFEDRGECVLAAIEQSAEIAAQRARIAFDSETAWVDRVRAGLHALLELFDEEPALAELCVVQSAAAGPETLARRKEVLEQLARVLDEGSANSRRESSPPLAAEGVVGGAIGILHARLLKADPEPMVDLLGPLMSFIVLPFLGEGAARKELERPAPSTPSRARPVDRGAGVVESLQIRLTYRTIRVLAAIAADPGLSNAHVSERAGVTDQGQISKLLARLARMDLVENVGGGQAKGEPNAWRLTAKGRQLQRTIGRESSRGQTPGV
jgi:AcrR family transcriptional regulator/DNA-binding MarR family transcriptional regulator